MIVGFTSQLIMGKSLVVQVSILVIVQVSEDIQRGAGYLRLAIQAGEEHDSGLFFRCDWKVTGSITANKYVYRVVRDKVRDKIVK